MKKLLSLTLSLLLLLSTAACSASQEQSAEPSATPAAAPQQTEAPPAAQPAAGYQAGTYTAEATGHNCNFTVDVIFSDSAIEDIIIGENSETGYLGEYAMEMVRQDILENQTVNVDTVSGATVSSAALRAAVAQAVKDAGGDPAAMPAPAAEVRTYEDVTTQVVVVGSGTAGLAATVEANEQGLDVILVEQLGILGGSSVRTGYVMGGSTQLQAEAGISEGYTKEDFVNYLAVSKATGTGGGNRSEINEDLYHEESAVRIAESAGDNIDWLQSLGVKMRVDGFIHRGDGSRFGPYLLRAMDSVLKERSIDTRLNTRAESLLVEDGRVRGVQVEAPDGTSYNIYADAVILATGGYNANQDLIAQYNPKYAGYMTDVSVGADGSGMQMAEAAGGQLICMDQANYHSFALVWRGASRSMSSVITSGAIAVNAEGVRFLNEDTYYDKSAADAITAQTGGVCYVILNQQIIDTVCVPGDNHLANDISMYEKGGTVEELAGKLGIDAQALAATLDGYSASVEAGEDKEFGRSEQYLTTSYREGPFYGAKAMPELHTDHGGVVIDIDTRVLGSGGAPIPGLYAAGEVTASHVLGSTTNTVCLAHGRIAARTVLEDLNQ